MKTSITERAHLREVAAADRVLEERVAGEDELVADDEGDHVVGVARRRDAADAEPAPLPLARLGDDRDPVPVAQLVLVDDVVVVRVRPEDDGRRRRPSASTAATSGADVGAGVDEDGRPALAVGDDVGVREPVGMHAPLDEHRR